MRDRRREHRAGLRHSLAQLDQSLPRRARERSGCASGGGFFACSGVVATQLGHEREREKDGGDTRRELTSGRLERPARTYDP